jgi:hypothetical protein
LSAFSWHSEWMRVKNVTNAPSIYRGVVAV